MISYGDGSGYLKNSGAWGFVTMFLMNRAATGSFMDISALTLKPFKAFTFFMIGVSIS